MMWRIAVAKIGIPTRPPPKPASLEAEYLIRQL